MSPASSYLWKRGRDLGHSDHGTLVPTGVTWPVVAASLVALTAVVLIARRVEARR